MPGNPGLLSQSPAWLSNRPKGIVVREQRAGWVTLELPPLEAWSEPLKWITPPQRERIESPEFYQLLQQHITKRWTAQRPVPG